MSVRYWLPWRCCRSDLQTWFIPLLVLSKYMRARRYETFTLHSLLQNLKINNCSWVIGRRGKPVQASPQEAAHRKQLLGELLYWVVDSWLVSLLKVNENTPFCPSLENLHSKVAFLSNRQTTFYISESGVYKNRMLYFRKDDWHDVCQPLLQQVAGSLFEPISFVRAHAPKACIDEGC